MASNAGVTDKRPLGSAHGFRTERIEIRYYIHGSLKEAGRSGGKLGRLESGVHGSEILLEAGAPRCREG